MSAFTLLSRVLGLCRDIVLASFFGASAGADAFLVAFKIPNFMRRLFAEGAFAQAFVPVLSEVKGRDDHEAVKRLVNHVMGNLGSLLALFTLLGVLLAPWIVMVFAPGFIQNGEKITLAADLLRITFPYLFLISLTAFAGSILNTYSLFAIPAFAPVLLNIALISSALWLSPYFDHPVEALAWGVLVAGVLQLLLHAYPLWRLKLFPIPRIDWQDREVKKILHLMLPALFGVSVSQINLMLDTLLASFLETGSVTWLYFSDRLVELPLGVFGIAIATAILPRLSKIHVKSDQVSFSQTIDWALKVVILIGLPAAVALVVLAEPIITTLFHHNAFSAYDVANTSRSLSAYALGVLAFMLIKILAPAYFARQDTKTPVKIAIKAMLANMVFNVLLVFSFAHVGLALATALSAWLNAALLLMGLLKLDAYQPDKGWLKFMARVMLASGLMAIVVGLLAADGARWLDFSTVDRLVALTGLVVAGLATYFATVWVLGLRLAQFKI